MPCADKRIRHFPLELHDIIFDGIVPLSYQFDHCIMFFIIGHQHFEINSAVAEIIPLRMDIIVVNGLSELKLEYTRP